MNADICGFPDNRAVSGQASGNQVLRHLGLAVDGDGLAGQFAEVDANAPAANGNLGAVMHQPFAMQALGNAGLFEQSNRSLLQHARPNAGLNIVARPRFQNDALDAMDLQQAGEQKPCRPGSDDAHLGTLALRHLPEPSIIHSRRQFVGRQNKISRGPFQGATNPINTRVWGCLGGKQMFRRELLIAAALSVVSSGAFAQDTVKIGLILPMTGQQASTGKQIDAAVKLYRRRTATRSPARRSR